MWLFRKQTYSNDEEIIKAYKKSGDKKLIGELFEKHVRKVYGSCLYYFKDKEQAEDAAMQIFEKLIHELRVKEVINFQGWLSYVVRNHCLSVLKINQRCGRQIHQSKGFEYVMPDESEEQQLENTKLDAYLEHLPELIKKLNEPQRICIEQFYLKQRSYQEISEFTGYSLNEVKSHIQNGKRNLKLMLLKKDEQKAA